MPLIWKSPQLIITLPNIVIIKLIVAATEKRSPKKKYVPIKAKTGCKVTRTTELATDVRLNDSNHSMKCKARNNPEIAASTQFFLDMVYISSLYFKSLVITFMITAKYIR